MKILLIGERFSPNLGDGVICEIVEKCGNCAHWVWGEVGQ